VSGSPSEPAPASEAPAPPEAPAPSPAPEPATTAPGSLSEPAPAPNPKVVPMRPRKAKQPDAPPSPVPPDRDKQLDFLSQVFKVKIIDVTKRLGEEPSWTVVLASGQEIALGDAGGLVDQRAVRTAFGNVTDRLIKHFGFVAWEHAMSVLMQAA